MPYEKKLYWAAKTGDLTKVKHYLRLGASINAKQEHGETALLTAASAGKLEIVKELIEQGADVNQQNDEGFTALIYAAWIGYQTIVEYLVSKNAEVNLQTSGGLTALMYAAWDGHLATVKYLVGRGANVNQQTITGGTALLFAADDFQPATVKYLMSIGANVEERKLKEILERISLESVLSHCRKKHYFLCKTPSMHKKLNIILQALSDHTDEKKSFCLDFTNWGLTDQEAVQIIEAIINNKALKITSLTFSSNKLLSKHTATNLAALLSQHASLDSINLSQTGINYRPWFIGLSCIAALAGALINNKNLKSLALSDCRLTDRDFVELLDIIKSKENGLQYLDLTNNGIITDKHSNALKDAVRQNNQLRGIELNGTGLEKIQGEINSLIMQRFDRAAADLKKSSSAETNQTVPSPSQVIHTILPVEESKSQAQKGQPVVAPIQNNAPSLATQSRDSTLSIIHAIYQGDLTTLQQHLFNPANTELDFTAAVGKLITETLSPMEKKALFEARGSWVALEKNEKQKVQSDRLCLKDCATYEPIIILTITRGHLPITRWLLQYLEQKYGKALDPQTQKILLKLTVANSFKKMSLFQTNVLDLSDELLDVKDVFQGLVTLLPHDKNIKELILHHNDLSSLFSQLMEALKNNQTVEVLDLSKCHVNDKQIPLLIAMLQQNRHIKTIRLQANLAISYQGIQQLIKAFMAIPRMNTTVQTIDINHNSQLEASLSAKLAKCLGQHNVASAAQQTNPVSLLPVYQEPAEITSSLVRERDPRGTQTCEPVVEAIKVTYQIKSCEQEQQALNTKLQQTEEPLEQVRIKERLNALAIELNQMQRTLKGLVTRCETLEAESQSRLEGLDAFNDNPKLRTYYKNVARKLEELFIGCKAVGSQMVRYTDRTITGYACLIGEGASQAVLALDDIQNAIRALNIPLVNIIPTLFEMGGIITNIQEKNALQKISYQWSLTELQRAARDIARGLTERYQMQILQLPDKAYEEGPINQAQHAISALLIWLSNGQRRTLIDLVANYAALHVLCALKEERIIRFEADDEMSLQDLIKQAIDSLVIPDTGLIGYLKSWQETTLAFDKEKQWTVRGFYQLPGIQCMTGERYNDDKKGGTNARLYGYRLGTDAEVKQFGYELVADNVGEQEKPIMQEQRLAIKPVAGITLLNIKFTEEFDTMRNDITQLKGDVRSIRAELTNMRNEFDTGLKAIRKMFLPPSDGIIAQSLDGTSHRKSQELTGTNFVAGIKSAFEAIGERASPPLSSSHTSVHRISVNRAEEPILTEKAAPGVPKPPL